jgi:hypothetical protein
MLFEVTASATCECVCVSDEWCAARVCVADLLYIFHLLYFFHPAFHVAAGAMQHRQVGQRWQE